MLKKKIISAGLILSAVLFYNTSKKAQVASARSIAEVATKKK